MAEIVTVPAHRPIKPVYVRQFVMLADKAKEIEDERERTQNPPR
jgi:hypothetical protein